ncbi:MAG: phospholipase D-like domain-containing protein [Vicinamibacteria bacterium]
MKPEAGLVEAKPLTPSVAAPPASQGLSDQVFSRTAGAELVHGNDIRILKDAAENYPAWMEAIGSAQRSVHFENYIIHDDEVGVRFCDAFIAKAREGVSVRIVYDWIGCIGRASAKQWRRLREGGVEVRSFNPPKLDQPLGWVARDHRKCLVVDGQIAFVTGLCIGKMWEGTEEKGLGPWRDTGVVMRGPAVRDVALAFADSWASMGSPLPAEELAASENLARAGDLSVRVVASTPGSASLYRLDPLVASLARKTLWLTDAYFAGTSMYVQALRAAASDGVDVRLLVPGPGGDIPLMQTISRTGYRTLLEGGVRVFEWNGPMMHAKSAVADARWARVGSSNLNLSSWIGNRELDIVVEDQNFGKLMEDMFVSDLANSTEIVLKTRRKVRTAGDVRVKRPKRAGGSGTRVAAGAMRIGNVIGSALTARRLHQDTERGLMAEGGVVLGVIAVVGSIWPRLLAWPMALLCMWFSLALIYRSLRRRRVENDGTSTRTIGPSASHAGSAPLEVDSVKGAVPAATQESAHP